MSRGAGRGGARSPALVRSSLGEYAQIERSHLVENAATSWAYRRRCARQPRKELLTTICRSRAGGTIHYGWRIDPFTAARFMKGAT